MSWKLQALVSDRRCGSPTRRLVLISMAARANDDGSGVYASLPTISAWCEVDARTVRRVVRELEAEGLITVAGRRRIRNGYLNDWTMQVEVLEALPRIVDELRARREGTPITVSDVDMSDPETPTTSGDTGQDVRPDNLTTGQNVRPHRTESPVTPDTVSAKPILEPISPDGEHGPAAARNDDPPERRASRLPANWLPDAKMIETAAKANLSPDEIAALVAEFVEYWSCRIDKNSRRTARGWRMAFQNRVTAVASDRRERAKLGVLVAAGAARAGEWSNAQRLEHYRTTGEWRPHWGARPEADLFMATTGAAS